MKLLKIFFIFGFFIGLLSFAKPVQAQSCEINLTGPFVRGGTNNVCVGGFSSEQELRNYRLEMWCERVSVSSDPNSLTTFCGQAQGADILASLGLGSGRLQSVDFAGVRQIGQSGNTYYTCFDLLGINPRIHAVTFNVVNKTTNQTSCNTGAAYVSNPAGPSLTCPDGKSINTALGCINTSDFGGLVSQILTIAIGIGGGAALLLMAYGVFIITTSTGIPDKINEGKNIITAAIGGLLFIVLSVVLFKVLGVDVLGLPGLQ